MKLNLNIYFRSIFLFWLILLTISFQGCYESEQNSFEADVIIYGGTSSALIAAVEVVQPGK